MTKTLCCALLLLLANAVCASESDRRQVEGQHAERWQPPSGLTQNPVWPNGAPDSESFAHGVERMQLRTSADGDARRTYTQVIDVSEPSLTIFPPQGVNTGAAIVVFPGGGFQILAIDIEGTEICDWIAAKGMTCALLKYRVPKSNHYWDKDCRCHITPKVPYALQDAQRAIRLVRSKAKEHAIDPAKIGVIGFSAGGYLVAQTSNLFDSTYPPVDEIDQLSSRPDFAIALYPGHLCRSGTTFDPGIKVTRQTPPTVLLQAWDDPVDKICNGTLYARALDDAGVPAEIHFFAKGGHAFGLRPYPHPVSAWPALVENWLLAIGITTTPP